MNLKKNATKINISVYLLTKFSKNGRCIAVSVIFRCKNIRGVLFFSFVSSLSTKSACEPFCLPKMELYREIMSTPILASTDLKMISEILDRGWTLVGIFQSQLGTFF